MCSSQLRVGHCGQLLGSCSDATLWSQQQRESLSAMVLLNVFMHSFARSFISTVVQALARCFLPWLSLSNEHRESLLRLVPHTRWFAVVGDLEFVCLETHCRHLQPRTSRWSCACSAWLSSLNWSPNMCSVVFETVHFRNLPRSTTVCCNRVANATCAD